MFKFDAPQPLLPEILKLHGHWLGNKDALIFGDERVSWSAFANGLSRFASALLEIGLAPNDRVAVVMSNCASTATALFGVMTAGCASVPINLTVTNDTLAGMIVDAGARCIIVSADQQARIEAIRPHLPADLVLITTGPASDDWHSLTGLIEQSPETKELPLISGDSVLNIIYSSGTTGQPKGIVHSYQGRLDWAYDLALTLRYHYGAKTLVTIGLYSNISWVAMLCTLLVGGTLIIREKFDARDALEAIEEHGVTHMSMVPIQYQRLHEAQQLSGVDLSSVQAPMSCGSPLQPDLKAALFGDFPDGIIELYGLTEGIITTLQPEDARDRWSSVGKPLIGTDIKIIDEQDVELPAGQAGEIVSRGRITMPGYLGREQASREASWLDPQGNLWLRSGDIGMLDKDNFLYIVDRKKDMILSGGQNIYPQDIEAVISRHDQVDDVAVIPAASERWGETPVALIVPKGAAPDPAELVSWCNERVGRHQRIADAIFVDGLPRNPNGKILKKDLREKFKSLNYS